METVYLETTVISYLVALPSRDLIVAAHQQISREWWEQRRHAFRCVVSQVVLDEIAGGNESEVEKRLEMVKPLDVLGASADAEALTQAIIDAGAMPQKAVRDAAHIALATAHGIQYLLTWNCRHLANAQIAGRIQKVCNGLGFNMPMICTPEELLEDLSSV